MFRFFRFCKRKFDRLGPGFITGAADDDPSGIATYSIAGARFGYKLSWLSFFLLPMMSCIQEMCGRIGMISGMGLAGTIKKYYSKKLLYVMIVLLFIANTVNIGADLGAMAASLEMIIGLPFLLWLVLVTILTVIMEIFIPYEKYSRYLKWMGLSLLVYGATAILSKQNLPSLIRYTFLPYIEFDLNYLMTMVGFIGTSISPYLFFWQASEQVEEEIKEGKIQEFEEKPAVVEAEISHLQKDTNAGMFFSQLIAFFIVITTAATLHAHGITDIETPQQAALALQPLAGNFAYLLFAFGIIGIGLQSVPILAGGVAYAFAEVFGFKEGLAKQLTEAKAFYATIGISTVIGALMNIIGINVIKALYYTAIINCLVAIPMIIVIIKLADDERIVGKYKSHGWRKKFSWMAVVFMGLAVFLMIANSLRS